MLSSPICLRSLTTIGCVMKALVLTTTTTTTTAFVALGDPFPGLKNEVSYRTWLVQSYTDLGPVEPRRCNYSLKAVVHYFLSVEVICVCNVCNVFSACSIYRIYRLLKIKAMQLLNSWSLPFNHLSKT